MVDTEHPVVTEPQDEPSYRMLALGGDHVTVSGMTKHYITLINEAIMANPHHPMVEGMELGRYLSVIVASDGGVPHEDYLYMLNAFPEEESEPEAPEEELSDRDVMRIRNLVDNAGWTPERAHLSVTGKLPGGAALRTTVSHPTSRKPRAKRRIYPVSKVPDNDSAQDPYWKAGDGPADRTEEQDMQLAALRAASIADIKRLRLAQQEILQPKEIKNAPSLTIWKLEDAQLLKQSFGMAGFYPETEVEGKAFKRMNGRTDRMLNGLSYFDDLAYRKGIASNAEKKAALEDEASELLDVLNQSLDAKAYAWDIIHSIDGSGSGQNVAFDKAFSYDDLVSNPNLRAQLGSLARFRDNQKIIDGEEPAEGDVDSPESQVEIMSALIHQSLGDMSVSAIRKLATELVKDQDKRFDYWYDRLTEAKDHGYVRELLESGLDEIDKRLEEDSK